MAVSGLHGMICALDGEIQCWIGYVRVSTNDQNTDLATKTLLFVQDVNKYLKINSLDKDRTD